MNKILMLLSAAVLSACGFHLKGHFPSGRLPAQNWHVAGGALQQPLENAIRYASGNPVAAENAQARIEVIAVDGKKDIYTITRAARLNEYLLSLRVSAQAYHDDKPWGQPMHVEIRRVMPYSDSMVLGKQEEEQTLWREMQQDAANQIVRQLGFLN